MQEEVFVSPRKLLEQQQLWVSFAQFSGFWPVLLKSSHKVAFLLITLSSSTLLHSPLQFTTVCSAPRLEPLKEGLRILCLFQFDYRYFLESAL